MWNPVLSDPIARLERDLSRLGARLGAIEHAVSRLGEPDRTCFSSELVRLDDELWRLDLRISSRAADASLLETELSVASAEISDLERVVERLRRPPELTRMSRLRPSLPERSAA